MRKPCEWALELQLRKGYPRNIKSAFLVKRLLITVNSLSLLMPLMSGGIRNASTSHMTCISPTKTKEMGINLNGHQDSLHSEGPPSYFRDTMPTDQ